MRAIPTSMMVRRSGFLLLAIWLAANPAVALLAHVVVAPHGQDAILSGGGQPAGSRILSSTRQLHQRFAMLRVADTPVTEPGLPAGRAVSGPTLPLSSETGRPLVVLRI